MKNLLPGANKITDTAKIVGEKWKKLPAAEQEKYKKLFEQKQKAYKIHLEKFNKYPDKFKNEKLSEKWSELIKIRNICNISIEEKRATKEIGSSLEADLKINLNQKLQKVTSNIDFSELCITSKAEVSYNEDVETTAITSKAKGTKCSVCWKINEGPCPRHP